MSKEIDWSKAPEGATHYHTEADIWYKQTHAAYQWDCGQWIKLERSDLGEYALRGLVERPAPVEWTGTGLPPVGTVCEGYAQGLDLTYTWRKCTVLHANKEECAVMLDYSVLRWCDQFRPIRTQAQIEAEEREKAVSDMLSMWMDCGSARDFCEYL